MRLIDADAMCADLATVDPRYKAMIEWGVRVTEAQPTVDAVEVVRCKDCLWRGKHGCYRSRDSYTWYNRPKDDDFCSWGERREDDSK